VVEEAFMRDNPQLLPDYITITCKQGYIQEARICLDQDLNPRLCGNDVVRDCTLDDAQFDPMR
jgi:ribonuclease T2